MMPRFGSLRFRLFAIIGLSTVVLSGAASVWMFFAVRADLTHALDARLAASARMVAGMISSPLGTSKRGLGRESQMQSPFVTPHGDSVACEISLTENGKVIQTIARTADSPRDANLPAGFSMLTSSGESWRTYALVEGNIRIQTADRMSSRSGLVRDVGFTALIPFSVAFVGVLTMIWVGVERGLAPLERIRRIVAARSPGDDSPVSFPKVPSELRPLTDTIEQLVARMSSAIVRERQFTDAAAHELRTPLAGLKLHLQVMQMAIETRASLTEVNTSVTHALSDAVRMQHVLDQLLRLARVETTPNAAEATEVGNVWSAVTGVIDQIGNLRCAGDRVRVQSCLAAKTTAAIPEVLLQMALRNLLDNALTYSPADTSVLLAISQTADGAIAFTVKDEGPGLTESQLSNATRRFWRASGDAKGSGLGLAIVSAVAHRVRGQLSLSNRVDRSGLIVTLSVPGAAKNSPRENFSLELIATDQLEETCSWGRS